MHNFSLRLFSILTFLLTNNVHGQGVTKGLILPDEGFDVCCIYIPVSGLKVYSEPNGSIVGELSPGTPDSNEEIYSASIQAGGNQEQFGYPNFEMVGYEVMAMTFRDARSHFVQLQNGYWLDVEELMAKKLKLTSWMEYILEKDTEWYPNDPGLNLRRNSIYRLQNTCTIERRSLGDQTNQ